MNKDEVITLSSDEENESVREPKMKNSSNKKMTRNVIIKCAENGVIKTRNIQIKKLSISKQNRIKKGLKRKKCSSVMQSPEVVDLEESSEKLSVEESGEPPEKKSNHSNNDQTGELEKDKSHISEKNPKDTEKSNGVENKNESSAFKNEETSAQKRVVINKVSHTISEKIKENPTDKYPQYFNEFVDFCGSLEPIPNDRTRLIKKLQKRFEEADPSYVRSQEFKAIIEKSRLKINKNNLYLIAKEVTDELSFRKTLATTIDNTDKNDQRKGEIENISKDCTPQTPQTRKRLKMLAKITKKLDMLGKKIKELEEAEVDLSDEEESVYVKLQRHRERFCKIYKRLCQITKEADDAERVFCRKVCFNGSKYPAINQCIEKWLNRTKRFPDFTDIMKLLESQAATLDLPSNKDSIRILATEIFQQVGAMLQRRRKYDLWDSFSGFLDDQRDPAENDPELESVLKQNFDARVKKEQEIFNYYAEKQEKEKLQPEEVPDEEANCSPVESESEDEKEIEKIEKSIIERLDNSIENDDIEENIKEIGLENDELKEESKGEGEPNHPPDLNLTKETKNNYKNCKSLKWKDGKRHQSKDSDKAEESASEVGDSAKENRQSEEDTEKKPEEAKEEPELELISEEPSYGSKEPLPMFQSPSPKPDLKSLICHRFPKDLSIVMAKNLKSYPGKKTKLATKEPEILEIDIDDENTENKKETFQIEYCQVEQRFSVSKLDFFDDCNDIKKEWSRGKVFRDLTNVNKLMELNGRKRKPVLLFSRFFQCRSFRKLGKPSWKKRSMQNCKLSGQKCALNYEKTTEKDVKKGNGNGEEKEAQNNSESGGDEGSSFSGGNKSGSDEDNNENDENKKKPNGSGDAGENEDEDEKDEEHEEEGDKAEDKTQELSVKEENSKNEERLTEESKAGEEENVKSENGEETEKKVEEKEKDVKGDEKEVKDKPETETKKVKETNAENSLKIMTRRQSRAKEGLSKNSVASPPPVEKPDSEIKKNNIKKENRLTRQTSKEDDKTDDEKNNEDKVKKEPSNSLQVTRVTANPKPEERRNSQTKEPPPPPTPPPPSPQSKNSITSPPTKTPARSIDVESMVRNIRKRNNTNISTSDEERVKKFLLHSPSSISITPPRKMTLPKPPSQAALQALETLRGLKGISATRVRMQPRREEDIVVIGESSTRQPEQSIQMKRRRNDLPVISNVQSIKSPNPTPKIVTVQGNVPGFGNANTVSGYGSTNAVSGYGNTNAVSGYGNANAVSGYGNANANRYSRPNNGQPASDSSSIRISNVWGGLSDSFYQSIQPNSGAVVPGCSFGGQNNPSSSNAGKKKTPKKTVEYVVLE